MFITDLEITFKDAEKEQNISMFSWIGGTHMRDNEGKYIDLHVSESRALSLRLKIQALIEEELLAAKLSSFIGDV